MVKGKIIILRDFNIYYIVYRGQQAIVEVQLTYLFNELEI